MIVPENLALRYYEFILNEDCNLRCKYCFDGYYSDRLSCNKKTSMDDENLYDILNFIDETRSRNGEVITFSFFGGEPTLNWEWIEKFVKIAKQSFIFPYRFMINTNAILLNSERINFLINNKFSVAISIDGSKYSHDLNRVDKFGNGSWEKVVKYLPELISKSKTINRRPAALMVVNKETAKDMYYNYKFLVDLGFNVEILYDTDHGVDEEYLNNIRENLTKILKYLPFPDLFRKRILNKNNHKSDSFCFKPDKNVSISPDGNIYFCHELIPKMKSSSNFEDFYGDIYKGYSNYNYFRKMESRCYFPNFKLNNNCKDCEAAFWCKGGCIASHYHKYKNYTDLNKDLCKINLTIHKVAKKVLGDKYGL